MKLKDKIYKLRDEGKSYNEIVTILECSKGTISYHCNPEVKIKTRERGKKLKKDNPLIAKTSRFRYGVQRKSKRFKQLKQDGKNDTLADFNYKDVINKIGDSPTCYLTGDEIDLSNPQGYNFDHIRPRSKGGRGTLENLGLTTVKANMSKHDMTVDEYLALCQKVLKHHGYEVKPPK